LEEKEEKEEKKKKVMEPKNEKDRKEKAEEESKQEKEKNETKKEKKTKEPKKEPEAEEGPKKGETLKKSKKRSDKKQTTEEESHRRKAQKSKKPASETTNVKEISSGSSALESEDTESSSGSESTISSRSSGSSSSSESSTTSEGVIPEPAIFQIEMNDGMGHISQHNITTLPRIGVFLAYSKIKTPLAFEIFLDRVSGVPQTVLFLKVNKANIPYVKEGRVRVRTCFDSVYFVNVSFGYAEHTEPDTILDILTKAEGLPEMKPEDITLFVPADTIRVGRNNILWKVLLYLYSALKSIFFGVHRMKLPPHNTIYIATVAELEGDDNGWCPLL